MNELVNSKSVMWLLVLMIISFGRVFAGDITMQGGYYTGRSWPAI